MPTFTSPKYKRRSQNNDYPVLQAQSAYIKELLQAGKFHHRNLTNQNNGNNSKQTLATLEMQCTSASLKCPCIKQVEEVGHHKDSEEQCKLICRHMSLLAQLKRQEVGELVYICMLEYI